MEPLAGETDRPDEAESLLARGMELARLRGHRQYVTWFGAGLAMQLIETGAWDEAFDVAGETLPDGDLLAANAVGAASYLAKVAFDRGDDETARRWLARVPPDLAASVDVGNLTTAETASSVAAALEGRLADVVRSLIRIWDLNASAGRWGSAAYVLEWAADATTLLGDASALAPVAGLYDAAPASALIRLTRAEGARVRARLAAADGAEDVAADAFAEALAAARSLGQNGHLAPILADYGLWLVECGRRDEAQPLLGEAQALFEAMGARRWLELIEAARPTAGVAG